MSEKPDQLLTRSKWLPIYWGFGLMVVAPWLSEGKWQLNGLQFTTTLSEQWSGYGIMIATLLALLWQAFAWWKLHRVSFWSLLLLGSYATVFAIVKWWHFRTLTSEFQTIAEDTGDYVSAGFGLYLLFAGGLLLLLAAFGSGLPQRIKKNKSQNIAR